MITPSKKVSGSCRRITDIEVRAGVVSVGVAPGNSRSERLSDSHWVARIDFQKLATELLALAALGGAPALWSCTDERSTRRCTEPLPDAAVS